MRDLEPEDRLRAVAQKLVIRPHRRRPRRPALAAWAATGGASLQLVEPPNLRLTEPEDSRGRLVAGGITTLFHIGALASLLLAAALAPPELIEKVIPVAILHTEKPIELPGSNLEPAPTGPKKVGARRANAAELAASQILTPGQAAAMRRAALEAARLAIVQLNIESAANPSRPTQIERRHVQADTVATRDAAVLAPAEAFDPRDLESVEIDPVDLQALVPELAGPSPIDPTSLTDLSVTEALAVLEALPESDHAGTVEAGALPTGGAYALPGVAVRIDSSATGGFATGGPRGGGPGGGEGTGTGGNGPGTGTGSGGTGTARGVVRCLESAGVQRYLDRVQERTSRRWTVPVGVAANTEVVLRFALDASGTANRVEGNPSDDATLSASARRALLSASPFPPLTQDNRCLTDKRIVLTFTVPAR